MHCVSRRDFVKSTVLCGVGATVVSCMATVQDTRQKKTDVVAFGFPGSNTQRFLQNSKG